MLNLIFESLILIVGDKKPNINNIYQILTANNFRSEIIDFSLDDYKIIYETISLKNPVAIIIDISLFSDAGLSLCNLIKTNASTESIIIILIYPKKISLEKKTRFYDIVDDFLTNPIEKKEFILRLNTKLTRKILYLRLLESNNLMNAELDEAKNLLDSLLPSSSDFSNLEQKYNVTIDAHYQPSSILGGDFYNAFVIDDNRIGFYLWDFSGHGVVAAINTLRLNSVISFNQEYNDNPGMFITQINQTLNKIGKHRFFATMFYGIINFKSRVLEYSYASCPYPILISHKRGDYKLITTKEFPLGVVGDYSFKNEIIALDDWDTLILYSDALIETENLNTKLFWNADALAKLILKSTKPQFHEFSATLIKEIILNEFNENYKRNLKDDLTLIIITF